MKLLLICLASLLVASWAACTEPRPRNGIYDCFVDGAVVFEFEFDDDEYVQEWENSQCKYWGDYTVDLENRYMVFYHNQCENENECIGAIVDSNGECDNYLHTDFVLGPDCLSFAAKDQFGNRYTCQYDRTAQSSSDAFALRASLVVMIAIVFAALL